MGWLQHRFHWYRSMAFRSRRLFVFRRSLLSLFGLGAFALAGCGTSAQTTGVSASLGAHTLPTITLPAYVPGPLDGVSTPRKLALRRPLAIVVENYAPDSRPQAGLSRASTVFETLAEGGVTRFMAVYLEHDAAKVGPVRSTRMYFDYWAAGLHTILAHVGGNDDALTLLWHLPKVFNLDENRWEKSLYDTGTPLFWRSSTRVAPHNMYTSTYKLRAYAKRNGENWVYTQASFPHKRAAIRAERGSGTTIDLKFENPLYPADVPAYDVKYVYSRSSNTYERFMGGAPHVDANNGTVLRPSNVVVLRTGPAIADLAAGPTPQSILIPVTGKGVAWYFMDGHVRRGVWKKGSDPNAPLQLLSEKGRPVAFDPGQTWIEVMPPNSPATWSVR
jgi:hypothetical protein